MLHNFTQLFLTSWNLLLTILLLYRSFSKLNIYNFIFKLFFALCSCYPPNFKTQTHWLFLCYPLLYPSLSQYFIQWLGTQLILNIYLLTGLILKDCLIPTFFGQEMNCFRFFKDCLLGLKFFFFPNASDVEHALVYKYIITLNIIIVL